MCKLFFCFSFWKIIARKVDNIHVRDDCIRVLLVSFFSVEHVFFIELVEKLLLVLLLPFQFPNIRITRIVLKVCCFNFASFQLIVSSVFLVLFDTFESYLFPFIISACFLFPTILHPQLFSFFSSLLYLSFYVLPPDNCNISTCLRNSVTPIHSFLFSVYLPDSLLARFSVFSSSLNSSSLNKT